MQFTRYAISAGDLTVLRYYRVFYAGHPADDPAQLDLPDLVFALISTIRCISTCFTYLDNVKLNAESAKDAEKRFKRAVSDSNTIA